MSGEGISYVEIAERFEVTHQAIRYWCWTNEKRKDVNKRHQDNKTVEQQSKNYKEHMEYKKGLLDKTALKVFYRDQSRIFRELNPEYNKNYLRKRNGRIQRYNRHSKNL